MYQNIFTAQNHCVVTMESLSCNSIEAFGIGFIVVPRQTLVAGGAYERDSLINDLEYIEGIPVGVYAEHSRSTGNV